MNYIIFDLEFNQATKTNDTPQIPKDDLKCPFEIIQIGAIKLNHRLCKISDFNAFVKPSIFKEVHPFIEKLTHITTEQLIHEHTFDKVIKDFALFIEDQNNTLVTWGMSDMKELFRNITYHNLDTNLIPKQYINIQADAAKLLMAPNGKTIGLQSAVELLNLPMTYDFHDALNDAYYTTQVFKKIYTTYIKPSIYNLNPPPKGYQDINKRELDEKSLIKQFEKMYGRDLTIQEIEMIILSYKMGATHQFMV